MRNSSRVLKIDPIGVGQFEPVQFRGGCITDFLSGPFRNEIIANWTRMNVVDQFIIFYKCIPTIRVYTTNKETNTRN